MNLYRSKIELENDGDIYKVRIFQGRQRLTYGQVLELWQVDRSFRTFYIEILKSSPFESFRWETPAVSLDTVNQDFEFVLLNSPYLSNAANPGAFREFFQGQEEGDGVVVFPNLGRDAVLVVPAPREPGSAYAHLAAFLRVAPDAQNHALWAAVGEAMQKNLGHQRIWLNTAGGGIPWLHVRLDSRPKYYLYREYRDLSPLSNPTR